jgi:vanillate O-demethylase monooxygenase subunit
MKAVGYPRNQWYVAAFASELTTTPIERWILGEPVVLFRSEDGRPIALDNRCVHRGYPLHKGRVHGDTIECGYHGFRFDPSGACVRIPTQTHIPAKTCVRSFPVAQPSLLVWIWMGDPALADESKIPAHPWLGNPEWHLAMTSQFVVNAPFVLFNDNLLDLSHVSFLHVSSFDARGRIARTETEEELTDTHVRVGRYMPGEDVPPFYRDMLHIEGTIDRWLTTTHYPPAFHLVQVEFVQSGKPRSEAFVHYATQFGTPEAPDRTRVFYANCRTYLRGNAKVDEVTQKHTSGVLREDAVAMEDQFRLMRDAPSPRREVSAKCDAGVIHARRLLERQVQLETGTTPSSEALDEAAS